MLKVSWVAGLVNDMAKALGIDLVDEAIEGRLDEERLREAVEKCQHCAANQTCTQWVSEHRRGSDGPPEFCCNADFWRKLTENSPDAKSGGQS